MSKEQRALIDLDPGQQTTIHGRKVVRTIDAGWKVTDLDGFPFLVTYSLPTALELVQP